MQGITIVDVKSWLLMPKLQRLVFRGDLGFVFINFDLHTAQPVITLPAHLTTSLSPPTSPRLVEESRPLLYQTDLYLFYNRTNRRNIVHLGVLESS